MTRLSTQYTSDT